MSESQRTGAKGVKAAMARYGTPLTEHVEIPVSQETWTIGASSRTVGSQKWYSW